MRPKNVIAVQTVRWALWQTVSVAGDRAVDGAVYGAVCEVSGAIRWTDDGTAESGVSGAGHNDPDHPALQDFMRSAAAGVGAV